MKLLHYTPVLPPYKHQEEACLRGWDKPGYGWLMEMGTGKSKVGIDNACMLVQTKGLRVIVIIAPKGTYANWYYNELPKHLPPLFQSISQIYLYEGRGTVKEQNEMIDMLKDNGAVKILVINIEAITVSERAWKFVAQLVRVAKSMVIVDESSTIKNMSAERTKRILKLRDIVSYRRIATGTPVTRDPLDLFSQFEFLYPECLGAINYYVFRARYCVLQESEIYFKNKKKDNQVDTKKVKAVVGHKNIDQLTRLMSRFASIVRKEDCLDLPPKVFEQYEVELTSEQQRIYAEMREWACAEIEAGDFASATVAITRLLRLHQIVCGYVVNEDKEIRDIPSNRVTALTELVEQTSGQNIIWSNYRRNVDQIIEALRKMGRHPVRYDGSVNTDGRRLAVDMFQDGIATDFVGTQSAGGYGITLTAASTVIYFSNNYDLEKRLQSEDRAHRIGQTKSVTYVDMVARGTVDERIMDVLLKKQDLANLIMSGPGRIREFV
jgi:SNF2 family DNA or RNA helicase